METKVQIALTVQIFTWLELNPTVLGAGKWQTYETL